MKIGPSGDSPLSGTGSTGSTGSTSRASSSDKSKTQSTTASSQSSESSAMVALSSTASSLLQGVNEANADFDAEKVGRISQALADGSFKVNAEVIADKLIANAKELLTNAQR